MSGFSDRVERDLNEIAGQATPSSSGWEAIQERIAEQAPETTVEVIMLSPDSKPPTESRNWMVAAAAVLAIVVGGAIFTVSRDDGGAVVDTDPPAGEVTTVTPQTTEAPATTEAPTTAELTSSTAGFRTPTDMVAGTELEDGSYRYETDPLGMTIDFTVPGRYQIVYARPGEFQIVRAAEESVNFVVAARIGGWYSREEAADVDFVEEASFAPNDVEGWIADNGHVTTRLPDVEIDGHPASVYDLQLDPASEVRSNGGCSAACSLLYTVPSVSFDPVFARDDNTTLEVGFQTRLWVVEVDGFEPIVIWAGYRGEPGFLETFESEILPTIEFGPDGPSMPAQ